MIKNDITELSAELKAKILAKINEKNVTSTTYKESEHLKKEWYQDNFLSDCALDKHIKVNYLHTWPDKFKNILVTGSTGYVGAHILKELLDTSTATIICIVRAKDIDHGLSRIQHNLKALNIWTPSYTKRLKIVLGDLRKPYLGLSTTTFNDLSKKIDCIFHSAALVNFTLPYNQLKAANVDCIKTLLHFSTLHKTIPVNHISTYSVLLDGTLSKEQAGYETPLQQTNPQHFLDYSKSKWVSEKIIEIALTRHLPVKTFRLGIVTGDSKTGSYNEKDFLTNLFKYCIKIQAYPTIDINVDMTPINYVREVVSYIGLKKTNNSIFHITNPQSISWEKLMSTINTLEFKLIQKSEQQWINDIHNIEQANNDSYLELFKPLFCRENFSLEKIGIPKDTIIDSQNTQKEIKNTSITCPQINKTLLNTYLNEFFNEDINNSAFSPITNSTKNKIQEYQSKKKPTFLQSFMHKNVAIAATDINQFIQSKSNSNKKHISFLANSHLEAFDGAIKLIRHYSRKKKLKQMSIIVIDANDFLKQSTHPIPNNPSINTRPNIQLCNNFDLTKHSSVIPCGIIFTLKQTNTAKTKEYLTYCKKKKIPFILDLSNYHLSLLPTLPQCDGYIFGPNVTDNQVPTGVFSVTKELYSPWNTFDNCILHTSTFGANPLISTFISTFLTPLLETPDKHIQSENIRSHKDTIRAYTTYINPKLPLLLKSIGMTVEIKETSESSILFKKGNRYTKSIDALGSFGSNLTGHNPSSIYNTLLNVENYTLQKLEKKIKALTHFSYIFPAVSGASAVDSALTLALLSTPKKTHIICFKGGFSGKSLLSLTGTEKEKYRAPFKPLYENVTYIDPFDENVIDSLLQALNKYKVGLIWLELIQGEAGVKSMPKHLINFIQEQKKAHNYNIGVDEIQTGISRTGSLFNYQQKSIYPDILTIGKGISNMIFPFGATLVTKEIFAQSTKTNPTLTHKLRHYYCNPLGGSVAENALLCCQSEQLSIQAKDKGNYILEKLKAIKSPLIKEIRGEGLLIAIELNGQLAPFNLPFIKNYVAAIVAGSAFKNNNQSILLAFTLNNPCTLRIEPPLTISYEDCDKIIKNLKTTLSISPWKHILNSLV